ncbi:MAG: thioredoxin family protein [Steroidobacteraceae bacterium]|jgi:thiol-disulfide isomerase/thioredoxin
MEASKIMDARRICLSLLLVLAGCQKSQPPQAQHATHANEPRDIAWFDGSLQGAFIVAKRENRPVLLYWGAEWCPFCHTLKSKVFSRPDFIAKSHLFLPVYLDGDDEGAQKWGEQFAIQGYPTLIVLDPERHEIIRLGAGRDVAQYAAILDTALEDVQPIDPLLQAAAGGKSLSADECRRLAYNSWELDTLDENDYRERSDQLQAAMAQCPANLQLERASLTIHAAYYAANAESGALDAPQAAPSARLTALTDQVSGILAQPALAVSSADALQMLDDSYFKAVRQRGPKFAQALRDGYLGTMDAAANDERYVEADQLGFIDAKLRALKALGGPKSKLPADVVAAANMRIDAALDSEQNPYVRSGLVNASLNILEDSGNYPKAYQIAKAEMARSSMPYYFEADLAEVAEKMGQMDEAVSLLDQAYRESQGAATRFQWGQLYVSGLLRMTPKDSARIQDAGSAVLAELDGPDRIYRRARVRLETLDRELRAWNDASKGQHHDVLQALHARMQEICVKIPDKEPARASCDAFLKSV